MNNKYYRHFKGNYYKLLFIAKDSADPDREIVVYQALYGEHGIWIHPKEEFFSSIEREIIDPVRGSIHYSGPRFAEVSEEEAKSTSK
ncbi:MAG: DUF1653 domain-containing protein [Bacteroidales bacterium]|nr:DUF1653 domain-containing protein [Bacteroidales bacterium]